MREEDGLDLWEMGEEEKGGTMVEEKELRGGGFVRLNSTLDFFGHFSLGFHSSADLDIE